MDKDGNGRLSRSELRAMLQSDAFDCTYEDVDEAHAETARKPFGESGFVKPTWVPVLLL